jgi:5-methylcytosine-specific restriction protein A
VPDRAPRQCGYHGCPIMRPCPAHVDPATAKAKDLETHRDPNVRRLYASKEWKYLRDQQLDSFPLCQSHGEAGKDVPAEEVDHIVRHRGDPNLFFDPANLQSLCHPCHSRKTALELLHGQVAPRPVPPLPPGVRPGLATTPRGHATATTSPPRPAGGPSPPPANDRAHGPLGTPGGLPGASAGDGGGIGNSGGLRRLPAGAGPRTRPQVERGGGSAPPGGV